MSMIPINREDYNLEVLAKIANSMAKKYGCLIKFNPKTKSIYFTGNEEYKALIMQDALAIFKN